MCWPWHTGSFYLAAVGVFWGTLDCIQRLVVVSYKKSTGRTTGNALEDRLEKTHDSTEVSGYLISDHWDIHCNNNMTSMVNGFPATKMVPQIITSDLVN